MRAMVHDAVLLGMQSKHSAPHAELSLLGEVNSWVAVEEHETLDTVHHNQVSYCADRQQLHRFVVPSVLA